MKSTYKLIGLFLDHEDIPPEVPCFRHNVIDNSAIVKLSTLLSLNESKLSELPTSNDYIQIMVDYVPDSSTQITTSFYIKRVLQLVERLQKLKIHCIFVPDPLTDVFKSLQNHVNNYYKKKAHSTVGAAL